jgi:hypothetical protein
MGEAPTRHRCSECGRPARVGGRQCARCYQQKYRSTPEGKRHHNDAVIRYNARNPDKHRLWKHRWLHSIGYWNPELREVQRALSALDTALGRAGGPNVVRLTSQPSGDDGVDR